MATKMNECPVCSHPFGQPIDLARHYYWSHGQHDTIVGDEYFPYENTGLPWTWEEAVSYIHSRLLGVKP